MCENTHCANFGQTRYKVTKMTLCHHIVHLVFWFNKKNYIITCFDLDIVRTKTNFRQNEKLCAPTHDTVIPKQTKQIPIINVSNQPLDIKNSRMLNKVLLLIIIKNNIFS